MTSTSLKTSTPTSHCTHDAHDTDTVYRLPSKDGLLDWDCAEAIDIPAMANTLRYIRQNGAIPVRTLCLYRPST